jgi:hypothetical protein
MTLMVGAEDERRSHADFTACFTAKTARTQRGTAQKRRPPGTGFLGRNQPTTQELSRTHINTTSHNHTTTTPLSIHLTTHTNTTRRYKSYHLHSRLRTRISQTSTTQITPKHQNKKTSLISRIPSELTVDNGKQFDSQDFRDFCFFIGTKLAFASVYHPQSNGVVERANGKIFTAIKKMLLDDKKGKWPDLLPEAVWALNTTECRATGFTPFRLLYGSEAMTPQEIKHGSPWTSASAVPDVDEPTSKDLIDGDRVFALQALNKNQAQTKA